jgi:hypothetical protein
VAYHGVSVVTRPWSKAPPELIAVPLSFSLSFFVLRSSSFSFFSNEADTVRVVSCRACVVSCRVRVSCRVLMNVLQLKKKMMEELKVEVNSFLCTRYLNGTLRRAATDWRQASALTRHDTTRAACHQGFNTSASTRTTRPT